MYRFKMDKLVRDVTPTFLRQCGLTVHYHVMDAEKYKKSLRDKILEEAQEVALSGTAQEVCEECADVLDVMTTLLKLYGMTLDDVHDASQRKGHIRGGFDERMYVSYVDVPGHDEKTLTHYRSQPEKYPEILFKDREDK